MSEQPYNDHPPFVSGSDTSYAAASSVKSDTATLRGECFALISAAGDFGRTCDEVEDNMQSRHQTISARIRELCLMGAIKDSGRRRPTRSGRSARVYVVVPKQLALL